MESEIQNKLKTEIKSELCVCRTDIVPAGNEYYNKTLKDYDIEGLIEKLEEKDIRISLHDSLKSFNFYNLGEKKESVVPFNFYLDPSLLITEYLLRAGKLEIKLQDSFEKLGKVEGTLGGPAYYKTGIKSTFFMKGKYKEGKIIETAANVVHNHYKHLV